MHPNRTAARASEPAPTAASAANLAAVARIGPWRHELARVVHGPAHRATRIEKWSLPDASDLETLGFYPSWGLYAARSHWRLELPDGREIHVLEQDDHYLVHWDHVSLRGNPVGHLMADAPWVAIATGVALLLIGGGTSAGAGAGA